MKKSSAEKVSDDIERLAKNAENAARERMGAGWRLLSAELREALIAREALVIIAHNEEFEGWQRAAKLADKVLAGDR